MGFGADVGTMVHQLRVEGIVWRSRGQQQRRGCKRLDVRGYALTNIPPSMELSAALQRR